MSEDVSRLIHAREATKCQLRVQISLRDKAESEIKRLRKQIQVIDLELRRARARKEQP